jgi:hypothetical protein
MESERNRPDRLRTGERPRSEIEQVWNETYGNMMDEGISPTEVADQVINAIREEKFYVFPHPELLESVRVRMETMLQQRNPTLDLPDEIKAVSGVLNK